MMKKDYVESEKNCQCFLKRKGKIQLNQFKSINTQKNMAYGNPPKKQMEMIHHQGNAHMQLAQLLILCNLNLTMQNKQKNSNITKFTKHTTCMKNLTGESKQKFSNYMSKIKKKQTNKVEHD